MAAATSSMPTPRESELARIELRAHGVLLRSR